MPRDLRKEVGYPRFKRVEMYALAIRVGVRPEDVVTWDDSTRRSRLPPGWSSTIQPRILARDGRRCYRCGGPATEVDHVQAGDDHSDSNLAAICTECHRAKTANEANTARWSKGRMARPRESHPGLN